MCSTNNDEGGHLVALVFIPAPVKLGGRSGVCYDGIAMPNEFPTRYDSSQESEIYKHWEESGAFAPDASRPFDSAQDISERPYFSIVLPPPNVTGTLHVGHAVMLAIEDMMVRYHRMKGDRTLWVPGLDHAAIATQNVVEKKLKKENVRGRRTRHELGREAFLEEVAKFVEQSKARIITQMKAMGASLDWSRLAYTLDSARSNAVREMFVRMYEAGILYRGNRIVNWCPRCKSTLADDEVEYKEEKTPFYYFKYGPVVIGTARPETKFQDKTLVVHPKDERYKDFVGKAFEVVWIEDQPLKSNVIADPIIDPTFGTGAMTITPAHSFDDFDLAQKHGLPIVTIINEDGKLTAAAGSFAGRNAREARADIVSVLQKKGLVDHIDEQYTHNLSICYRCETPVEPLPKLQWFVDVNKKFRPPQSGQHRVLTTRDDGLLSLKDLAVAAVGDGPEQIHILPERFMKEYFHWMKNLRDWCISRQIWFGHRLPVWYCIGCGEVRVNPEIKGNWYFVRHGVTDWNLERRLQGHQGTPLNEEGRRQARTAAQQLKGKHIDLVISSDLQRAKETAEIIAEELGGIETLFDDGLRERCYGELEGKIYTELGTSFTDKLLKPDETPRGGESLLQVEERIHAAIGKHRERHKHRNAVIVSHGAALRSLLRRLKRKTVDEMAQLHIGNAEVIHLALAGDCPKCTLDFVEQDPDTLDTWFSSGMWTFSTLGWPDAAAGQQDSRTAGQNDLEAFHPTSVLETGYDILFFWIARMILMTEFALGEVPFRTVYLHGLVRDAKGRKMSKSLGNVIDPLDMTAKYGADAVRLALFIGTSPGQDTKLDEQKIAGYAKFVTKVWNIARYVLAQPQADSRKLQASNFSPSSEEGEREGEGGIGIADRWLLVRRDALINTVTDSYDQHEYSKAAQLAYDFAWHEFADWYVESTKIRRTAASSKVLHETLEILLKLLHPAMPFVTEALWRAFMGEQAWKSKGIGMLMGQEWPKALSSISSQEDLNAGDTFNFVKELVTVIRHIRNAEKIPPKTLLDITLAPGNNEERAWCADAELQAFLKHFARAREVQVGEGGVGTPHVTVRATTIYVVPVS